MATKKITKTTYVQADITPLEREKAKKTAKKQGMSFKGWVGMVIKKNLQEGASK